MRRVRRTPGTPQRARERANVAPAAVQAAGKIVGPFSAASHAASGGAVPPDRQAAQKGPDARRRAMPGYPPQVGRRRTPRTPQRARERANAAPVATEAAGKIVGPFSAASHAASGGAIPPDRQAAQKGPDARRRAMRRVRRTPRTPQRARERANAADGPFSAASHAESGGAAITSSYLCRTVIRPECWKTSSVTSKAVRVISTCGVQQPSPR